MKLYFKKRDFGIIDEALEIAEDLTANFYKFSTTQWKKRHKYDVRTLISLKKYQITDKAFAVIYQDKIKDLSCVPQKIENVYLICLQDHLILRAILEDKNLSLLPFLVYILTHELVHIVRFCNFYQSFYSEDKEKEEEIVDSITFEILKSVKLPRLSYVLEMYAKGGEGYASI